MQMRFFSLTILLLLGHVACAGDVEVGLVKWGRDLDGALQRTGAGGKPTLVLFQEVPGCAGCRKFGQEVLSHPQVVEAIESEFEPVLVYNNRPGRDAEILARFREPSWNFQVIRFLDSDGKDILPRKDGVWETGDLAVRMVRALEAAKRPVPNYLRALAGIKLANEPARAAFAMHCFWTGELVFGGVPGVIRTEAGWLENREVTLVEFDRSLVSFDELLEHASRSDCDRKVFATNATDAERARAKQLPTGELGNEYRAARASDQKRQIRGTTWERLNLSPTQATKLNALARRNPDDAVSWLSPRQKALLLKQP